MVADPGVEPRTKDYESFVIPFHQSAVLFIQKNQASL